MAGVADMTEKKETILLVDDEPVVCIALADALRRNGYYVMEAGNYYQADKIADEFRRTIDLLITDIALPGQNGCDLANHLLETRPEMKVLLISGYTGAEVCHHYGVQLTDLHFLPKPFGPGELAERARQVMESSEKFSLDRNSPSKATLTSGASGA